MLLIVLLGCSSSADIASPEGIGEKERVRVVDGNQASQIINRMHNQSVAADANVVAQYGKEKKDLLYVSYYADQKQAKKAFDLMIEKMAAAKKGMVFHLMLLNTYTKPVYFTLGMGARHYIYQSGNYLLWLQTYQSFDDKLPPRLLKLYPV
jgi:hypothetical protein